ncbi:uncharacterized protein PG998_010634 [Apiospora kogelbergensis]|uniref:uncharacterized protein n=1 Tax=Apiospora kogelbergensis TaxID=1337665 RepID=UPI00312F5571
MLLMPLLSAATLAVAAAAIPETYAPVLLEPGVGHAYTVHAASALSVCVCGRAVWGAVLPLFTRDLFAALSFRWAFPSPPS